MSTRFVSSREIILMIIDDDQVQLQHVFEVRELEEITEEWLHSKLKKN